MDPSAEREIDEQLPLVVVVVVVGTLEATTTVIAANKVTLHLITLMSLDFSHTRAHTLLLVARSG